MTLYAQPHQLSNLDLPPHLSAICTAPRAPRQAAFKHPRIASIFSPLPVAVELPSIDEAVRTNASSTAVVSTVTTSLQNDVVENASPSGLPNVIQTNLNGEGSHLQKDGQVQQDGDDENMSSATREVIDIDELFKHEDNANTSVEKEEEKAEPQQAANVPIAIAQVDFDFNAPNEAAVGEVKEEAATFREIPWLSIAPTKKRKVLVIVVRADPIICGHSTEARNLAEAALAKGYEPYIVTWNESLIANSGLPLKPTHEIEPYSPGITVLRPNAVGNYKLLDGRYNLGMTAQIVEIARQDPSMEMTLMCLYLQPHARIVLDAVDALRGMWGNSFKVTTVAEAVGSDVTNVLSNALVDQNYGAAITVLTQFLAFDVPVCVSQFTLDEVLRHATEVDTILGSDFASRLKAKCTISYPALNVRTYTHLDPTVASEVLAKRGLEKKKYVLYLSRVIEAKGIFELVEGFRASKLVAAGYTLLIVGRGEALADVTELTLGDPNIRHMTDMADWEKAAIFDAAACYVLPSKFHPTFVETFGIVITEAMLTNCGPVITCKTGGIPEAAGKHCFYADVDSSASLRTNLEKAVLGMSDEACAEMTRGAREHSMQFSRDNVWALLESKVEAAREAKTMAAKLKLI